MSHGGHDESCGAIPALANPHDAAVSHRGMVGHVGESEGQVGHAGESCGTWRYTWL